MEGEREIVWISEEFETGLASVIIPVYNRVNLLREVIKSVVNQSYRPIECIVIDDGSEEDVKSLIDEFHGLQHTGFSLKYLYQLNAGSQAARNTGTKASSGEFIQYLDSDDLLYPHKLKTQIDFLKSNANSYAVFGNWRAGTEDKNELVEVYANDDLIEQFLIERCIANFSFLMRRKLVAAIGPWDVAIRRNQEIDYQLRGLVENARYSYIEMETGLLQTHSLPRISTTTGTLDILRFYQKWEQLLDQKGLFTERLRKKIAATYIWFFTMDIRHNKVTVELLTEAMRLDASNDFFKSKKLKFLRRLAGTKPAIQLWLSWMIHNRRKQQAVGN